MRRFSAIKLLLCFAVALHYCCLSGAQVNPPLKIIHAEPLYIDLIRDLGAHRGEREWNVGAAFTDFNEYDSYAFLVEYEWAVRDRWGVEIELPVTLFSPNGRDGISPRKDRELPANRIESLKLATQYTFLVSSAWQTSLAVGGILEFEFTDLELLRRDQLFQGILYNPFFIAAKRLGSNWHSLLYTGPRILQHFGHKGVDLGYEANFNVHYMLSGTRNFIGLEVNAVFQENRSDIVFRPQMRLQLSEQLLVGLVPGIPLNRKKEGLSFFTRIIYEPGHASSNKRHARH